jgi:hypothetical protein
MTRHSVNSSNIASIGHDPNTQELEVEFKSGQVYRYTGVSAADHRELMNAGSIGQHFHRRIKSSFPGSKV